MVITRRLCWFPCLFVIVTSYSVTDLTSLSSTLLQNYNKDLRPGADQSQATNVTLTISFINLHDFSETTGLFAARLSFLITWIDERLSWNPGTNNGITETHFTQNSIWVPHLILANAYSNYQGFGSDKLLVSVSPSGLVKWNFLELLESTCSVDITNFPYDKQRCQMNFLFLGYTSSQVDFTSCSLTMDKAQKNSLWDIDEKSRISTTDLDMRSRLSTEFTFSRKSDPYMYNIVFPMICIAILHLTVFILPAESGERVGFSTTVILAIAVYLTIINDQLPNSTLPRLANIVYKLFVDFFISIFIHACVVVSLVFYLREEEHDIPKCLSLCTRCLICKRRNSNKLQPVSQKTESSGDKMDLASQGTSEGDDKSMITWKDVSKAWDIVAATTSLLAIVLSNVTFFSFLQ
ncbi:neuronal acetylcholine receptor subunit alpha-6-like [Saccostrea echinata]|uniref:neuronal acetylcholine receptor subunit alpha-6-like n=1 Tax=Saccostrea echinata TaxID=191078 RepID=UPI002A80984D|nr:neuronal acetylcholine receptor subunit alpha-6-like [Saccostrea echinata]